MALASQPVGTPSAALFVFCLIFPPLSTSLMPLLLAGCSEPEVRIVLDIAKTLKPHAWVNVHSGMEAMFVPWDHVATVSVIRVQGRHL
jgi:hypothetical protein